MNSNDKNPLDIFNIDINNLFDEDTNKKEKIEVLDFDDNSEIEVLNFDNEKVNDIEVLDIQDITPSNIEVLDIDDDKKIEILDILDEKKNEKSKEEYQDVEENNLNTYVYKPRTKNKLKTKKLILLIILVLIIVGIIFSVYKIVKWQLDNNSIDKQITKIQQDTVIDEKDDNENTIIIDNNNDDNNDIENNNPEETNDYYRFIKMPLINVDLTNLQSQNSDTIGWLQVNGTNINYPVVKTDNNDYYLNHDFNKKYNDGGWIFADYRNNLIDDKNLIIYGHARLNLTMFGTLKNVIKANWYQNSDNYLVRLSTINSNMSFQVFSTYVTEAEDYYIKTDFNNNEDYLSFLNTLKSRSVYNYGVSLSENDRILTLSTCYTDNRRVVLHAKLIKYENR